MRFVTDEPITVAELLTRARTGTNLDGMRRWGYITIDGTARKIHHGHPGPGAVLRATTRGLRAREVWLPLTGLIEQRWRHRFGAGQVGLLREALAAVAGLLRVLGQEGIRLRDLPALTGISKEAVSWTLGVLTRARRAVEEPDPAASRGKVARLTARGLDAQLTHRELLAALEQRWRDRFTPAVIDALRQPLEALALPADGQPPPLFRGLQPYPDNWRARVRPPNLLPYYPMVLHRGGYPDGS